MTMRKSKICSSFPMYNLEEVSDLKYATDSLYSLICEEFHILNNNNRIDIPSDLLLNNDESVVILSDRGESGDLFLGQTCGWPVVYYPNAFKIVAIPHYNAVGCDGHLYSSLVIVHDSNNKHFSLSDIVIKCTHSENYVLAMNSRTSCSGCLLLAATLGNSVMKKISNNILYTGSHVNSIEAVSCKIADFAAIDCVTFQLLAKNRPDLVKSVRVIGSTINAPSLPYVTSAQTPLSVVKNIQLAMSRVIQKMNSSESSTDYRYEQVKSILLIDTVTFDLDNCRNKNSGEISSSFEDYYKSYMNTLQAKVSNANDDNSQCIQKKSSEWISNASLYLNPLLPLDSAFIDMLVSLVKLEILKIRNILEADSNVDIIKSYSVWRNIDSYRVARLVFPGGINNIMNNNFFSSSCEKDGDYYNLICFIGKRSNIEDCDEKDADIVRMCWSTDAKLIEKLNPSVVLAYVSAELQPGGDWGNIVLFKKGESVETSAYFTSDNNNSNNDDNVETHEIAWKEVAPKYYSKVRIHRVRLVKSINNDYIFIKRTLFLQYIKNDGISHSQLNCNRQIVHWVTEESRPSVGDDISQIIYSTEVKSRHASYLESLVSLDIGQPKGYSICESEEISFQTSIHLNLEKNIPDTDNLNNFGYTEDSISLFPSKVALTCSTFSVLSHQGLLGVRRSINNQIENGYSQSSPRIPHVLRGAAFRSSFIRDLSSCAKLTRYLSEVAQCDLIPHPMTIMHGHTNLMSTPSSNPSDDVDAWHHDTVTFVLIIFLSSPDDYTGGDFQYYRGTTSDAERCLKEVGSTSDQFLNNVSDVGLQQAGHGIFLQGSRIYHRAKKATGNERTTFVLSYIAAQPTSLDPCVNLSKTYNEIDPLHILLPEWVRYRCWKAQRLLLFWMQHMKNFMGYPTGIINTEFEMLFFKYFIKISSTRYELLLIVKNLPYIANRNRLSSILLNSIAQIRNVTLDNNVLISENKKLIEFIDKYNYLIKDMVNIVESTLSDLDNFREGISNMIYFKGVDN